MATTALDLQDTGHKERSVARKLLTEFQQEWTTLDSVP